MMPVARTLPASLPSRFAGARRAVARTESGSFELVLAERFGLRLRGLTGLEPGAIPPLLLPRCRSLHTFWMSSAIDVAWLDLRPGAERWDADVLRLDEEVERGRTLRCPASLARDVRRRVGALELPPGTGRVLAPAGATLEIALDRG
jgi:hypothetical protein